MADVGIRSDELRAVIFDVDGTLYRQPPVRRAMASRLLRAHWTNPRSAARIARVLAAYREAQETLRSDGFEGDVAIAQAELAARRTGADVTDVLALVDTWMELAPLDVVAVSARPGLVAMLTRMKARGLRLAALSDYPASRKLDALGVKEHFDVVLSAQDTRVGAFKPNPRGLVVTLGQLGVERHTAVYVGDRAEVDAAAAAAADVRCVLVGNARRRDGVVTVPRVRDLAGLVQTLGLG